MNDNERALIWKTAATFSTIVVILEILNPLIGVLFGREFLIDHADVVTYSIFVLAIAAFIVYLNLKPK